jgi:putative membrane protein
MSAPFSLGFEPVWPWSRFVIERFNLFLLALAGEAGEASLIRLHRLASPAGRYGGMALVGAGVVLIIVATVRFLETARLIEDDDAHTPRATRVTLVTLSILVLGVAGFSAYLAVGWSAIPDESEGDEQGEREADDRVQEEAVSEFIHGQTQLRKCAAAGGDGVRQIHIWPRPAVFVNFIFVSELRRRSSKFVQ